MTDIKKGNGKIRTFHITADSIPEAYWKAMKTVHENGYELRTQYDRKNPGGSYMDPAGKDAKVMIEIRKPFSQPRFPALSYCERGKYIAEFLGAKNHLVVPYKKLLEMVRGGKKFEPTQWPYCYHQRLTAYPKSDGSTMNQLEIILNRLAEDPLTRRAVAQTGVPEIDCFLEGDLPCLREIQLRALPNERGDLVLNMHARWRSRDLYKAWGDNLIGITSLQARLAKRLEEKTGRKVVVGPYVEDNGSLHIYGQDYNMKGAGNFLKNFPTVKSFLAASWTSEKAAELTILPELEELRAEPTWKFTPEALQIIDNLIEDYRTGRFTA